MLAAVLGAGSMTPAREQFVGIDWAATALGSPRDWSAQMRTVISTAMNSRFAMLVMAGPELVMVYNDAYVPSLGHRHPAAMGQRLQDVWHDEWPTLAPMVEAVWTTQEANHFADMQLTTTRSGFQEEAYFTFSYSPLLTPDGEVFAILNTVIETTSTLVSNRRLALAQELLRVSATVHEDLAAAAAGIVAALAQDLADIPAAVLLLLAHEDDIGSPLVLNAQSAEMPAIALDDPQVREWLRSALTQTREARLTAEGSWSGLGTAPAAVGGGVADTVLAMPLIPPGRTQPVGVLVAALTPHLLLDGPMRTFMEVTATQVAAVIGATQAHLTERAAAAASRSMAEALQRSLLTDPVQPDHLQLATRYVPAAAEAEVGGDWYDAFLCQDGSTWLVIGDVAGHDQDAAATMGQIRNLLRGITYTDQTSPAAVLTVLDHTMAGLGVGSLASVIAMRIEQHPGAAGSGVRQLRWSNAGHPPPIHLPAGGGARPLDTRPEMMLGARAGSDRTDHFLDVQPGDGVLLYTDGLTERRATDLDEGTAWLLRRLDELTGAPLEEVCDQLLRSVVSHADDDIALLALRAHPEDRERPPEAGARHIPDEHPTIGSPPAA